MIIKERFDEALNGVRASIAQDVRRGRAGDFFDREFGVCWLPSVPG
jgi:hypothetical protein